MKIEFNIKSRPFKKLPILSKVGVVLQSFGLITFFVALSLVFIKYKINYFWLLVCISLIMTIFGIIMQMVFDKKTQVKTKVGPWKGPFI